MSGQKHDLGIRKRRLAAERGQEALTRPQRRLKRLRERAAGYWPAKPPEWLLDAIREAERV